MLKKSCNLKIVFQVLLPSMNGVISEMIKRLTLNLPDKESNNMNMSEFIHIYFLFCRNSKFFIKIYKQKYSKPSLFSW